VHPSAKLNPAALRWSAPSRQTTRGASPGRPERRAGRLAKTEVHQPERPDYTHTPRALGLVLAERGNCQSANPLDRSVERRKPTDRGRISKAVELAQVEVMTAHTLGRQVAQRLPVMHGPEQAHARVRPEQNDGTTTPLHRAAAVGACGGALVSMRQHAPAQRSHHPEHYHGDGPLRAASVCAGALPDSRHHQ
jgi:hypothetical protein